MGMQTDRFPAPELGISIMSFLFIMMNIAVQNTWKFWTWQLWDGWALVFPVGLLPLIIFIIIFIFSIYSIFNNTLGFIFD